MQFLFLSIQEFLGDVNENIQLEINDDKKDNNKKEVSTDVVTNKDVSSTVSVEETKTNKIVSMGDETQTKKVTMNYFDQFVSKPDVTTDPVAVPDAKKEASPEDDDEEGVFEIEVDGVSYYTTDETNGDLYTIDVNGDPEDVVGKLIDGEAVFNKDI